MEHKLRCVAKSSMKISSHPAACISLEGFLLANTCRVKADVFTINSLINYPEKTSWQPRDTRELGPWFPFCSSLAKYTTPGSGSLGSGSCPCCCSAASSLSFSPQHVHGAAPGEASAAFPLLPSSPAPAAPEPTSAAPRGVRRGLLFLRSIVQRVRDPAAPSPAEFSTESQRWCQCLPLALLAVLSQAGVTSWEQQSVFLQGPLLKLESEGPWQQPGRAKSANQGLERGCAIQASHPKSHNLSLKYPCNGKKLLVVSPPGRQSIRQLKIVALHPPTCYHAGQPRVSSHGQTGPGGQASRVTSSYLHPRAERGRRAVLWNPPCLLPW